MATYELVNADQLDADLTAIGNAIRAKGETTGSLAFPNEMVEAIGAISTGVELNFEVVGGTTAPSNPKENMIWVNTSTKITSYIFSATQPTGSAGMVWISVGTSSSVAFNALRKNSVKVYPLSAKQYISDAWVNMDAQIYQSGVWVVFSTAKYYIFRSGEGAVESLKAYHETNASISISKNEITTNYTNNVSFYATSLRTNEKINLESFSILKMSCKPSDVLDNSYAVFGLTNKAFTNADMEESAFSAKVSITESSSKQTFSVDISNITSSFYVGFLFAGKMTVTNIWME